MVEVFGAKTPRPVLHPVNQAQGDLTRLPAFPNRAAASAGVRRRSQKRRSSVVQVAQSPVDSAVRPSPAELFALGRKSESHGDYERAARLWRLAADQGDAAAQTNLYEQGLGGLPRDEREAARLYRLAADQGNAWAQNSLGVYHEEGRGGLARDDLAAARLYRLAADQGYDAALYNLGSLYERGQGGLPRDLNEAVRLYQQAARAGHTGAQQQLRALGCNW